MRIMRIMFGVHSFCSCFVGESAGESDSSRSEFLICVT